MVTKGSTQLFAAKYGIVIVAPDTSPSKLLLPVTAVQCFLIILFLVFGTHFLIPVFTFSTFFNFLFAFSHELPWHSHFVLLPLKQLKVLARCFKTVKRTFLQGARVCVVAAVN